MSLSQRVKSFKRDESGSATVEAALWIPFFLALILLVVEVTFVFYGHSQMLRLAQDASRKLSVGWFSSTTETEEYILTSMKNLRNAGSSAATTDVSITNGVITTTISAPASELDVVGTFSALSNLTIAVSAQHMQEL